MENNISILTISDLLKCNFFIPSYQRGYRWTEQQINDLLNDIWNFIEPDPNKDDWYCLQPVVIKAKNDQWEVIDGQQRLTTIFLVLKHLEKFVESERRTFELEYETRNTEKSNSKDFLNNVHQKTEKESLDNIDYSYIYKAFVNINEWFKKKSKTHSSVSSKFITPFLEKTKVIWYETNEDDAVQIFTRINMGKIPLTNSELIKALFLNSSNFKFDKEKIHLKQLEIANEWDFIEYSLHNEEFWWFINKGENEKDTRIEFLFDLIVGKAPIEEDDTYTFRKYAEKFKSKLENEIEDNWKQVKRYFQTLQDWFNNRELYHKIGFLVTIGEDIKILIENSQAKDKIDYIKFIDGKIKEKFNNIQLSDIEYNNGIIRPILLLHNILTMLNNKKENSRFPFNRYKKENWDIEHIHAIATDMPKTEQHQKDWIKQAKVFLDDKKDLDFLKEIDNYSNDNFEKLFNKLLDYFSEKGTHEDINNLSNLTLLDARTNRSYKNAVFPVKRKTIIENEKTGTFIPICSRNVFMKYYSPKIEQMTFWGETDRIAYFKNIKKILKPYLSEQNNEDYEQYSK
jgi:hypothetical protein